jgi:hypothetical protein
VLEKLISPVTPITLSERSFSAIPCRVGFSDIPCRVGFSEACLIASIKALVAS